jgi:predicted RNase H-like HicB family nuclease
MSLSSSPRRLLNRRSGSDRPLPCSPTPSDLRAFDVVPSVGHDCPKMPKRNAQRYTISDGKLVLTLEESDEGGFVVSSPLYPGLWTQAESVREAFENARDALKALLETRRKPIPAVTTERKRKGRAA